MNSIRDKAREKAQSFRSNEKGLSNRQKAKDALRQDIQSYTGANVKKISAETEKSVHGEKIRVASYCRVSTDEEGQIISIELQKEESKKKIIETPGWIYYGTYVDDGFSGTNTQHRPGFTRMMTDALSGKFDYILTKSVSRFARNLLDCIGWVRKLQALDPPVGIIFEDVGLNTLDQKSSLILFVLAMVAEEESHMKSEAMQLSIEWRFSRGRFILPKLLGYDRGIGEDGKRTLLVNAEEAKTIRLMYYMLLNGSMPAEIAKTLMELHRPTGSGSYKWTGSGVTAVLRNERYCGDVLARKTYTPNYRDHKSKKNTGKKNRYYQPAHHEGIVSRAQWNAAQKILNSLRYGHKAGYTPIQVIDHGALCGYVLLNRTWAGTEISDYYLISNEAMKVDGGEMEDPIEEKYLPDAGHAIPGLCDDNGVLQIAGQISKAEEEIMKEMEGDQGDTWMHEKIKGFQVTEGSMFSHINDPVITVSRKGITISSVCMKKILVKEEWMDIEILLNPIERMLAIRPAKAQSSNSVRISKKQKNIHGTRLSSIIYKIMLWDENCSYRMPLILRRKNGEFTAFFDLDNAITVMPRGRLQEPHDPGDDKECTESDLKTDSKGFFFAAGEEDNPEIFQDTSELEEKIRIAKEIERITFGTPAYEHKGAVRLTAIDEDGEWDVMAAAVMAGHDHRIDDDTIMEMELEMTEGKDE